MLSDPLFSLKRGGGSNPNLMYAEKNWYFQSDLIMNTISSWPSCYPFLHWDLKIFFFFLLSLFFSGALLQIECKHLVAVWTQAADSIFCTDCWIAISSLCVPSSSLVALFLLVSSLGWINIVFLLVWTHILYSFWCLLSYITGKYDKLGVFFWTLMDIMFEAFSSSGLTNSKLKSNV